MKHQLTIGDAARIDRSKPVRVYRNLHKSCYSVQQGGIVVAHLDEFELTGVSFLVSEAGRRNCLREKRKNIHAFMVGYFASDCVGTTSRVGGCMYPIGYNPYKMSGFRTFSCESGAPVEKSALVSVLGKSVHALL